MREEDNDNLMIAGWYEDSVMMIVRGDEDGD